MNLEQKHFPMLREYEKAKMQMMNVDLSDEQTVHFNNTSNTFQRDPTANNTAFTN